MRNAKLSRNTKETRIAMKLSLDESVPGCIDTPLPFLTHMLETLACHSRWGLQIEAQGDIEVDPHHLVEDCGIVLGRTLARALDSARNNTQDNKQGSAQQIRRAGFFLFPMDRSLAQVVIDLCGRPNLVWNVPLGTAPLGNVNPGLFYDFFKGFIDGSQATLHVTVPHSSNDHHALEAIFKAFGRAAAQAVSMVNAPGPLSTKGVLND